MVTGYIIKALTALMTWITSTLPAPPVPAWYSSLSGSIDTLNSHMAGLGSWLPFNVLLPVAGAWLALLAVSAGIKVARIVASFLTAGGGSAG